MLNGQLSRYGSLLVVAMTVAVVLAASACENEAERAARISFEAASDTELLQGLEKAVPLYERIVREHPETKKATDARAKIQFFRQEQEKRVGLLLAASKGKPRAETLALLRPIVAKYPGTGAGEVAATQVHAIEEAIRVEREEEEERRQEEKRRQAEAERVRRLEDERRKQDLARQAEQTRIYQEREAQLRAEQARLATESQRISQAQAQPRTVVIEYSYNCECNCCGIAFTDRKGYRVSATSTSGAESKAYDYYGKGSRHNRYCLFGSCPDCRCTID